MKLEELKYLKLTELSEQLTVQYKNAVLAAFPPIIHNSAIIRDYWAKLEAYFPHLQLFAVNESDELVGFANTIAFAWSGPLNDLPDNGWDWMIQKGIDDHEKGNKLNSLGGLQVIVTKDYLGKGYSKVILAEAKKMREAEALENFVIPIRPTWKWKHPELSMTNYAQLKDGDKIYDPWIRTHLNAGAEVVKICENSMRVSGDVPFWEKMINHKIEASGDYVVPGALSKVTIDIAKNFGEYREANIWIKY